MESKTGLHSYFSASADASRLIGSAAQRKVGKFCSIHFGGLLFNRLVHTYLDIDTVVVTLAVYHSILGLH